MDFTTSEEWAKLSNAERIAHCQKAASDAEAQAEGANATMREIYNRLAAQWRRVADDIEGEAG
jgi:hypothetical protein